LAALTIASTFSVVMSPWMALIEATCRAMVPTVVPEAYGSTAVQMFRLDSQ